MGDPVFIRLPPGVGIEPDPSGSDPGCPGFRLVASTPDALALRHQLDHALAVLDGVDWLSAHPGVARLLADVLAAPLPVTPVVEVTTADEMPAGLEDPVAADPPWEWPYRVWAAWCAVNGVPQLAAVHALRRVASARGEDLPTGLRAIKGRPEYAAAVMDLAVTSKTVAR